MQNAELLSRFVHVLVLLSVVGELSDWGLAPDGLACDPARTNNAPGRVFAGLEVFQRGEQMRRRVNAKHVSRSFRHSTDPFESFNVRGLYHTRRRKGNGD